MSGTGKPSVVANRGRRMSSFVSTAADVTDEAHRLDGAGTNRGAGAILALPLGSPGCHGPGGPLQDDGGGRPGLPDRAERPAGPDGLGRHGRVELAADGLGTQVADEGQQGQLGHRISSSQKMAIIGCISNSSRLNGRPRRASVIPRRSARSAGPRSALGSLLVLLGRHHDNRDPPESTSGARTAHDIGGSNH
jgi:hypothetical protein